MLDLGMSTTSDVTKCKECIVLATPLAKSQMEQFKKARAQFLQATSQVVARLQQVDLAEFIAPQHTTNNHMTSTTTSPSIVELEKLLHAQALIIQKASQLEMAKWAVPDGPARSTARLIVPGRAWHESRAVLGPLPRPVVPARPGPHIYFYFIKHIIYIFRFYICYLQQIQSSCTG
jgi:hypothetical protein